MTLYLVPGYVGLKPFKEGGSALVLRGQRKADGAPVAVKVLKPEVANDKEHIAAFAQEAQILERLRCRSIVRVYEYVPQAKPLAAYVMEYFEAENLKVLLYENPTFVREHWHRIIYELAGAFLYIHKRGIIHRDMKPENVLVGLDGYAKLIDFSLAITKMAKPRKVSGTPTYMAPEQIAKQKITPQTDLYALGVTIYEILGGGPPFTGTVETVLEKHQKQIPLHIANRNAGVDPALASFVMRMLAKDPANRPQEAKELLALLKKVRSDPLPAPELPGRSQC